MYTEQLIHELSNGLIGWYPFRKGAKALYISDTARDFEFWADVLRERELDLQVFTLEEIENQKQESSHCYDYMIIPVVLEHSRDPRALLSTLRKLLNDDGRLLVAANNRFGIRYFCGDKDVYTGHVLDSIDNYMNVSTKRKEEIGGRSYQQKDLSFRFGKICRAVYWTVWTVL